MKAYFLDLMVQVVLYLYLKTVDSHASALNVSPEVSLRAHTKQPPPPHPSAPLLPGDLCRNVTCTAPECKVPGVCEPTTGYCSTPTFAPDKQTCSIGSCWQGVCKSEYTHTHTHTHTHTPHTHTHN